MEDLFDTFNRITQLRTRESELATPKAKHNLAGRYAKKKIRASESGQEILKEVFDRFELGGKGENFGKWLDLDHAMTGNGGDEKFLDLDYSPGPLEYSDEDEESQLISEENEQ